jgi:hypothetical protein
LATYLPHPEYGYVTGRTAMNKYALVALIAITAAPAVAPTEAAAQSHRYHGRTYHGRTYYGRGSYHRRCSGGDGAVGTIAGGAGGALIGNAVGGGTLGTIAGAVGGGLLGRTLDKQNTRSRRGC